MYKKNDKEKTNKFKLISLLTNSSEFDSSSSCTITEKKKHTQKETVSDPKSDSFMISGIDKLKSWVLYLVLDTVVFWVCTKDKYESYAMFS